MPIDRVLEHVGLTPGARLSVLLYALQKLALQLGDGLFGQRPEEHVELGHPPVLQVFLMSILEDVGEACVAQRFARGLLLLFLRESTHDVRGLVRFVLVPDLPSTLLDLVESINDLIRPTVSVALLFG